jgi:uncharacterized protein DUF4396
MTSHDTRPHHSGMGDGLHGLRRMAMSATLHCLTGCAIGEVLGLILGTAYGLSGAATVALSIALAFFFGYTLSTLPLLRAGLSLGGALTVVLAADTLSIATMELVDNLVVIVIPGAMNAGLVNPTFWLSMMLALTVAFFAAFPVNRYLLARGKGHALTHEYHGSSATPTGLARFIPVFSTPTLAGVIIAFMLGGLVVSIADEMSSNSDTQSIGVLAPGEDR